MSPDASTSARRRRNGRTSTANFGSGKRESHDASAFYDRFVAPEISDDDHIGASGELDVIHHGDSRDMSLVPSNSVALVVTSPPYFAGKAYEEELGVGGVPSDYFEYLDLLRDVFAECKRVLEPGGRIAVNVANLGRRPYRSLSADVTVILQDLGLLMRGEVIWSKGKAAGGSCAWGTFQSPANPVLRDVTERIVIASKGRFDRALTPRDRFRGGLPSTATISREEFMEATTDLWEIPPESATRIGHPAPFPVALPKRLTDLYTYEGDTVLDPFMGSGSTAVAALQTGRHYIGYDMDQSYIDIAEQRVSDERNRLASGDLGMEEVRVSVPVSVESTVERAVGGSTDLSSTDNRSDSGSDVYGLADALTVSRREGRQIKDYAETLLSECGFIDIRRSFKPRGLGVEMSFIASDSGGEDWVFEVAGSFTSTTSGLRRSDVLWRSLAKAAVLHQAFAPTALAVGSRVVGTHPLIVLTTDVPPRGTAGYRSLMGLVGPGRPIFDVVTILDPSDIERLRGIATAGAPTLADETAGG